MALKTGKIIFCKYKISVKSFAFVKYVLQKTEI